MALDTDTELAAWLTGAAVDGGVRGQFGKAQQGIIGNGAAVQNAGQELARLADLLGRWRGKHETS